ncbi:MFS transporter [Cellulomonas sp. URHB0016]
MESSTRAHARRPSSAVVPLALSLVLVELLAGMQRYLSQTVVPLVAAELQGARLYGPLDAAAQAPMFLMMPVGAWLLSRFQVRRLMVLFTTVTVVGSVLCAVAPTMPVFVAGTAVRALAAGALATVGMGAISQGLPTRYRQLVLGAMSGVWVFASVLGPVYAVAVTEMLSWRWAMVLYLPVLVLARLLVARYVPERTEEAVGEDAPWGWAVVLATGSAVLALPLGGWSAVAVVVGAGSMLWAARAILPTGTFRATRGRPAALSALLVTAAVYFGATTVLSVVSHDAFGLGARTFGLVIAAPGLTWALAGLWTGSHPAADEDAFRRRVLPAGSVITLGVAVVLGTTLLATDASRAMGGLLLGASLLGLGMGSLYPDLLGRCLTRPAVDDGISEDRMAAAVVVAESVGLALATTAAFTWLGTGFGVVDEPLRRAQVLYVVLLPSAVAMVGRLAAAGRSAR